MSSKKFENSVEKKLYLINIFVNLMKLRKNEQKWTIDTVILNKFFEKNVKFYSEKCWFIGS